jgi:hypothetical protein
MNKFNFKKELTKIEEYLLTEYQDIVKEFMLFMFENEITIADLKNIKINQTNFKDFELEFNGNALLLKKDNSIIELNYAINNSYRPNKKESGGYDLTPIKENELIDISFVKNNKTILYTSKYKVMHLIKENIKALYSPTQKEWTYTKNIKDSFYNKYIFIKSKVPQFHFIKDNEDGSLYKSIYISDNDHFGLEYFENKNTHIGNKIDIGIYIDVNGLIKKQ